MSLSTISETSSRKPIRCFQPSLVRALVGLPSRRVDFRRPEIPWVNTHKRAFGFAQIPRSCSPAPCHSIAIPTSAEGQFNELSHGMGFAGRKNIIIGFRLLQDKPHPLGIIARMSPVTFRIEIAEIETFLFT